MIERIRQALSEVSFTRGLAIGALVGAAIGGSTLWSRFREARDNRPARNDASIPRDRQTG